jgi:DNA topoisomerase-3
MEADLKRICQGTITPSEVLQRSINRYEEMFRKSRLDFHKIKQAMDTHFREADDGRHASSRGGRDGGDHGSAERRGDGGNRGRGAGGRGGRGGNGRGGSRGGGSNYTHGNHSDGDGDDNNNGNRPSRGRSSARGRGAGRHSNRSTPKFHQNASPAPICEHGKSMVVFTVRKEGPNKGKEFYSCPENDRCEAFHWVEAVPHTSPIAPRSFRNNNNSNGSAMNSMPSPFCKCSKPSVERTVTKESPHKGRQFYTCAKGQDNGCNFFEWADGLS